MNNAKIVYYSVLTFVSAAGGYIVKAFGGWDVALRMLCLCIAADYITGVLCAFVWKRSAKSEDGAFESKASVKGLLRKGMIFLVVLVAVQLDSYAGSEMLRSAAILFFTANEGFSIIENLGIMGVPFPKRIKEAFAMLRAAD